MRWQTVTALAMVALFSLGSRAESGLPGIRLIVNPPSISFNNVKPGISVSAAQQQLTVHVMAPGRRPWRLTVVALGNLQSPEGDQIPIQQVSWKGSPGAVFTSGTLTPGQPLLVAQGQGSQEGVLSFVLKNRWEYPAGRYGVALRFSITSP